MTAIKSETTAGRAAAHAAIREASNTLRAAIEHQEAIEHETAERAKAAAEAERRAGQAFRDGDIETARECMRDWAQVDPDSRGGARKRRRGVDHARYAVEVARDRHREACDALTLAERGWDELETYDETWAAVEDAIAAGEGLRVELEAGTVDLWGDELHEVWDELVPGEAFTIRAVLATS